MCPDTTVTMYLRRTLRGRCHSQRVALPGVGRSLCAHDARGETEKRLLHAFPFGLTHLSDRGFECTVARWSFTRSFSVQPDEVLVQGHGRIRTRGVWDSSNETGDQSLGDGAWPIENLRESAKYVLGEFHGAARFRVSIGHGGRR